MKRFFITSVILQAMLIAACTASAQGASGYRHDNRGRDTRNERVTNGRHGSDQRGGTTVHRHRPAKGTKYTNRPIRGQYCYVKGERLWLADGVFYRIAYTNRGTVYIVVGYM